MNGAFVFVSETGIDFAQFLNILHNHSRAEDCENEIMAAFAAQDRKGNGLISTKDFKAIMCHSGEKVDPRLGKPASCFFTLWDT